MTETDGQYFGAKCWQQGLNVDKTEEEAAKEIGIDQLSKNPRSWPPFVHGAEEAWQDLNLEHLEKLAKLNEMKKT